MALENGRTYRLEFAFVDRRAFLALDGKLVMPPADLPQVTARKEVSKPLQLGVRGILVRSTAASRRGPWYLANTRALSIALSNEYFRARGFPSLWQCC